MRQRSRNLMFVAVLLGLVICLGVSAPEAKAWDYCCPPTVHYYAPAPSYAYVPRPVVVYPSPTVVYRPYVYAPPMAGYAVSPTPYRYKECYRGRPGDFKYKYKLYSPYKRGAVYEYKVEVDNGRIEIEEDFD